MHPDDVERLERTVLEMVAQALTDYEQQAATIFREETDLPQDIAEDVTREAIGEMGMAGLRERLYGKVDVKRAIYAFLPDATPVALMLDAKAEKPNGDRTATIQMSQTSMEIRMTNSFGAPVIENGRLEQTIPRNGRELVVVTIVAKYVYTEQRNGYLLRQMIVACIPNGMLQDRYNPTPGDGIWLAGRHASSRGEEFRVRVSYAKLRAKAPWRVRIIEVEA